MTIRELILKNRSYRRFYESEAISRDQLVRWIDLARNSPSGRNAQPLKYYIANDASLNAGIYPTLAWAGYLTNWDGPEPGERPSAYIVMLGDTKISDNYFCDHGIAAQSILLGAVEEGFGGCIIASVKKNELASVLDIDSRYQILQVLALGKPKEQVVLEKMQNNDIKYWRDEKDVHHVPKRPLNEIVLNG